MKRTRRMRRYLHTLIFWISCGFLCLCLLFIGFLYQSTMDSLREKLYDTETAYTESLLLRTQSALEQIESLCYSFADVQIPWESYSDSSGYWTNMALVKLLRTPNDYITRIRVEIDGRTFNESGPITEKSLGRYSLFALSCEAKPVWPYYVNFQTTYASKLNAMTITVSAYHLGRQAFSGAKTGRREFLLTPEGIVLLSNQSAALFQSIEDTHPGALALALGASAKGALAEYGAFYLCVSAPDYYGYRILALIPRSLYSQRDSAAQWQFALMASFLALLSGLSIAFLSLRVYRPIKGFVSLLNLYTNDDIRGYENEIHYITGGIRRLIDRSKARESSFSEKMSGIQERQIAVQQYQIRSHFLFNSLENIKALSIHRLGAGNDVENSIVLLNDIIAESMRMAFIIPLSHEIKLARDYLGLMAVRFPDVRVSWAVEPGQLECRVFKLTLQPILENCYKHAFVGRADAEKRIAVRILGDGDDCLIRVSDNGAGLDEATKEKVARLLAGEGSEEDDAHVGIGNVHQRIVSLYGRGYGLRFLETDAGTTVEIRYPYTLAADGPDSAALPL